MSSKSNILECFRRNIDVYKREGCKETSVRVEFIDPSFQAPGCRNGN